MCRRSSWPDVCTSSLHLLKDQSSKRCRFIRSNNECKLDIERWRSLLAGLICQSGHKSLIIVCSRMLRAVTDLVTFIPANGSTANGPLITYYDSYCQQRHCRIQFCLDNQSVDAIISSGTSKESCTVAVRLNTFREKRTILLVLCLALTCRIFTN